MVNEKPEYKDPYEDAEIPTKVARILSIQQSMRTVEHQHRAQFYHKHREKVRERKQKVMYLIRTELKAIDDLEKSLTTARAKNAMEKKLKLTERKIYLHEQLENWLNSHDD